MNYNRIDVLLIEDNSDYAETLKIAARQDNNIMLSVANNGLNGISMAMTTKPDIILLDIMMPQMDGFEVIKAIKDNSSLTSRVIVLSNISGENNVKRALDLGADMFLQKSDYLPWQVIEKVKSLFGEKRSIETLKKALIVEDDPDLSELLKMAFAQKNIETKTAMDGVTAISTALTYRPDLIVLDIMLPQMNGYDVLQALRQNANIDTVIIANTNIPAEQGKAQALNLGADYFVSKSFFTPLEFVDKALEMYTNVVKRQ